jgi:SnoaL-like domain
MRKRIRGPFALTLVLACVLGAALLLSGNASTAGRHLTGPTDVSKSVASKYIAALTRRDGKGLAALFTANATETDHTDGLSVSGAESIAGAWQDAFNTAGYRFHGSVRCAGKDWAAVDFLTTGKNSMYQGGTVRTPGVSILELKNGKIMRETLYYQHIDQPPK